MFTKPAGVFLQFLGLVLLAVGGLLALAGSPGWGLPVLGASAGLFVLGRQTK